MGMWVGGGKRVCLGVGFCSLRDLQAQRWSWWQEEFLLLLAVRFRHLARLLWRAGPLGCIPHTSLAIDWSSCSSESVLSLNPLHAHAVGMFFLFMIWCLGVNRPDTPFYSTWGWIQHKKVKREVRQLPGLVDVEGPALIFVDGVDLKVFKEKEAFVFPVGCGASGSTKYEFVFQYPQGMPSRTSAAVCFTEKANFFLLLVTTASSIFATNMPHTLFCDLNVAEKSLSSSLSTRLCVETSFTNSTCRWNILPHYFFTGRHNGPLMNLIP